MDRQHKPKSNDQQEPQQVSYNPNAKNREQEHQVEGEFVDVLKKEGPRDQLREEEILESNKATQNLTSLEDDFDSEAAFKKESEISPELNVDPMQRGEMEQEETRPRQMNQNSVIRKWFAKALEESGESKINIQNQDLTQKGSSLRQGLKYSLEEDLSLQKSLNPESKSSAMVIKEFRAKLVWAMKESPETSITPEEIQDPTSETIQQHRESLAEAMQNEELPNETIEQIPTLKLVALAQLLKFPAPADALMLDDAHAMEELRNEIREQTDGQELHDKIDSLGQMVTILKDIVVKAKMGLSFSEASSYELKALMYTVQAAMIKVQSIKEEGVVNDARVDLGAKAQEDEEEIIDELVGRSDEYMSPDDQMEIQPGDLLMIIEKVVEAYEFATTDKYDIQKRIIDEDLKEEEDF